VEFKKGIWVRIIYLTRDIDPKITEHYPEYVQARTKTTGTQGVVLEQLAGLPGEVLLVEYRDINGEPIGVRAIHYDYELKVDFPLA
jgi:hypothetical protein